MGTSAINQTPFFSRAALRAIDCDAVEHYNIPSIVLMENAARSATECILHCTDREIRKNIIILCGRGNNGGDGYAVARHLSNANFCVRIFQLGAPNSVDAKVNASICAAMEIPMLPWNTDACCDTSLVIDAIFGIGIDRSVEGLFGDAIKACNASKTTCISLDIPSGMDCDTGLPLGCCIEATVTISFVGLKKGFLEECARRYLGKIEIADIGCPQVLLDKYRTIAT